MKLRIFSWCRADVIQPGTIVATDDNPDRPLHISEVRLQATGQDPDARLIELYGRPTADAEGRRHRLSYDDADAEVMVLPSPQLAGQLWRLVVDATAGQLPDKAAMPGPLADQPTRHPTVEASGDNSLIVHRGGTVWRIEPAPEPSLSADASPPDSDDEGT